MTYKICISGYYGFDNFGDEIILKILTSNLKQISSDFEITVFSSNPQKTKELYKVNSVKTFDIIKVLSSLLNCNCLISGGGSLLQDVTSKKSIIYYLGVIAAALFFRKKVIIFAQGIGPINNKFLAFCTKILLKKASLLTIRDEKSKELLKSWNIESVLCSDPVWNLSTSKQEYSNKLGIQLRQCKNIDTNFLKQLAVCVNKYYSDKEINLFLLQNNFDKTISEEFKTLLLNVNPKLNVKIIENISNEKVIQDISNTNVFIAMRFHACLIAIKNKIKLLPINYDIKVKELAENFKLNYINTDETNIETKFGMFAESQIKYDDEKINKMKYDFDILKKFL